VPHVDYICLQLYPDASEASGLEVDGILLVTNPSIGNTVELTCQVVGGQYSDNAYALQQMINQLSLNDQVVQWARSSVLRQSSTLRHISTVWMTSTAGNISPVR